MTLFSLFHRREVIICGACTIKKVTRQLTDFDFLARISRRTAYTWPNRSGSVPKTKEKIPFPEVGWIEDRFYAGPRGMRS